MGATPDLRAPSLADEGRSRNLARGSASLHLHPRRGRRAPRSRARPRTRELGPDRPQETPRVGAVRSHHHDSDTRFCATTASRHRLGVSLPTNRASARGPPSMRWPLVSRQSEFRYSQHLFVRGNLLIRQGGTAKLKGRNDRVYPMSSGSRASTQGRCVDPETQGCHDAFDHMEDRLLPLKQTVRHPLDRGPGSISVDLRSNASHNAAPVPCRVTRL